MSNHLFAPVISTVTVTPAFGPGGTVFTANVVASGRPNVRLSYQWRLDGVDIPGATRASLMASDSGQLTVVVTAQNNQGADTRESEPVHVCRSCGLPEILEVAISPAGGRVGDVFVATVRVDGVPAPVLSYQWLLDGRAVPGAFAPTYEAVASGLLSVLVTATSSEGSTTAESAGVAVAPVAAPAIASLAVTPRTGRVGDTFEAEAEVAGEAPIALAYQWLLDGAAIPGASDRTHVAASEGSLSVRLTATDANGSTSVQSEPAAVGPEREAPHVAAADILPNEGRVGDTFTVTAVVTGVPEPAVTYAWFLDGEAIAGVDGPTYTAEAAGRLFVRVSATNEAGSDARESGTASVEPAALAPAITSATLLPEVGRVGDVFAAVVAASGDPEPQISFAWYLDGAPIEGEATGTYRANEPGALAAEVTASNGAGTTKRLTPVATVAPALAAPVIRTATIDPLGGRVGERFTAVVDAGGEPAPDLAFLWSLDGAPVPGATGPSLVPETPGLLAVTVTATNEAGEAVATASVAVAPALAAPRVRSATIVPASGTVGDMFSVEVDVAGEPAPGVTFQWYLDDAPITGATGSRIEARAPGALAVRVTAANAVGSDERIAEAVAVSPVPELPWPGPIDLEQVAFEADGYDGRPGFGGVDFSSALGGARTRVRVLESQEATALGALDGAAFRLRVFRGITQPTTAFTAEIPRADGALDWTSGGRDPEGAVVNVKLYWQRVSDGEFRDATGVHQYVVEAPSAPVPVPVAPVVSLADLVPNAGKVGDTFTVLATAAGEPQPTLTYQWFLDGVALPSATGTTYTATAAGTLFARVRAVNAAGSDERESGAVLVAPATEAPRLEAARIEPGGGVVGDLFTARATVTGTPQPVVTFQWTLDGAPIPDAVAVDHRAAAAGALGVTITARNDAGTAQAQAPAAIVAPVAQTGDVFVPGVFVTGVFA
jgi:large repetitive protein